MCHRHGVFHAGFFYCSRKKISGLAEPKGRIDSIDRMRTGFPLQDKTFPSEGICMRSFCTFTLTESTCALLSSRGQIHAHIVCVEVHLENLRPKCIENAFANSTSVSRF